MKPSLKLVLGLLILCVSAGSTVEQLQPGRPTAGAATPAGPRIDPAFGRMPLYFIPNRGQLDGRAAYYIAGRDKSIYFGADGLTISLTQFGPVKRGQKGKTGQTKRWAVKLDFVGAAPGVMPAGEAKTGAVISYFKGRPEEWKAGIPAYGRIVYRDLWPGIDLAYSGTTDRLKYQFVVHPGADPSKIRLIYRGASSVDVDGDGRLEVGTPLGGFQDEAPLAYQERDGQRITVPVAFRLEPNDIGAGRRTGASVDTGLISRAYGFATGEYDPDLPLVIDPATLIYCGFIGGSANDRGTALAVDGSGNAYVTGFTGSFDFPVKVGPDLGFNSSIGGMDAFVAEVAADGTGLVYCGFIGGSWDDIGSGIALDASGNAYVSGWTFSQDFPAIVGPSLTHSGNITQFSDAFVAKVTAGGTGLLYSGFIGGSLSDQATAIAVDGFGNAYITGGTESSDFPTVGGPDLTYNGAQDAFVAKVAADGTGLDYSGFIGGQSDEAGTGIAVDTSGNAYITGITTSFPTEHFPVTVGPSLTYGGTQDAFVAKVNASGSALVYCGYIGGTDIDIGAGIAVDPQGNAYVTGTADSGFHFPVTVGPDLTHNGGHDAFVAKVAASGANLVYCGFIGGTGSDYGAAIAVDASGIAYVAGSTDSQSGFPLSGGPSSVQAGFLDAFVATVDPSGANLIYSGYIGGSSDDEAAGVAADGAGNVYVAGYTRSINLPVLVGPSLFPGAGLGGSSDDAFVAKIFEDLPPAPPANLHATNVTAGEVDIAWTDRSTNENGFRIERKTGDAGTWAQIGSVGPNITTFPDPGRAEGTTYVYRVRAFNTIGNSAYSNELGVLTRPAAPTGLTAAAINERRVNLSWTDHSASESGFRVERKINAGDPWAAVGTVTANETAFADTHVLENTTYTYHVLAFNSGGDSAPSNEASATTPPLTIPIAPSGLVAAALSATQVRLTWTDNSYNEDGFKIERKTGSAGAWAQVGSAAADAISADDGGLTESTTYYYRIRASNNAGDSGYSNEAPVTTPINQPILRVPVSNVVFGNVNECTLLDMTTVLYNDGGAPLAVTGIARTSGATDFTYQTPAVPFNVPPLSSQAITVRFSPSNTGLVSAVFTVLSNDPANGSVQFGASGTGFVPTIGLALQVQRLTERAWIIRRDYGLITLTVTKSAPFNVTTYRLSRKAGAGSYQTIKDFTEANLPSGVLTYADTFLATGTTYTYKVEALDCGGRVIASSSELGPLSTVKQPAAKPAGRIVKR
ncbi:MAG: SBBP repeat-containing protein [Candidatus Aminicenantales bacterium]